MLLYHSSTPNDMNSNNYVTKHPLLWRGLGRLLTLVALLSSAVSYAQNEGPTMGWSSWNTFELNINEATIKGQANAMVTRGLLDAGYNHINIDDGYFGGRDASTGQLKIHPTRFPNGLQPIVDYIHSKGLKAGIYSDGGYNTCGSYHGGDKDGEGVGLYKHDQQDCDFFFKELGFDFIKVDFCGGDPVHNKDGLDLDERQRYTAIAKAISNTGRTDVRMNICRWAYPGVWANEAGFSWRTTQDIFPSWDSVKDILAQNLYMSAYSSKGHYNDMDMLEVGVNKWGNQLNAEETKTHFGLWCIMNSPLLIGCDMRSLSSTNLNLLRNKELIALNQDTLYQQAYLVGCQNGCYTLVKDLERRDSTLRAFAVYNPTDERKTVQVSFVDLCLAGDVALRDVFQKKDLGQFRDSYEVTLPAHGTRIYVASAETRLERRRYEAETGYSNAYSEIEWNVCQYAQADYCSSGYKAGYLGRSEKNDLQWRDVYSQEGGDYNLTIGFICGESRSITVSVNGKKVKTLSVNSGGWSKVAIRTLAVQLEKGQNTIRLSNASGWMPDLDYIDLEPVVPTAIKPLLKPNAPETVYDLQGRPVDAATARGVIVSGGRKVLR